MKTKNQHGFTLIELMVVVVVVTILAAIAYPSYMDSVRKGRRSDGKSALLSAAQTMERYFTENMTYSGWALGTAVTSPEKYYTIAFDSAPTSSTICGASVTTSPSATAYRLCASPAGPQTSDPCGTLSLSNTGERTPSTGACW